MEAEPDSPYPPGRLVALETGERRFTFAVDKTFAPFTKSIVLLAKCDDQSSTSAVIKIYDPRFLDERISQIASQPSRPWTLAAEQAATIARNTASDSDFFDESQLWGDEPEGDQGRAERAVLWEEYFYRLSAGCFDAEHAAYDRLQDIQGSAIPRLLASGRVLPPDTRAIQPFALVLEYIPGVSLRDIASDLLSPEICSSLVRNIDAFATHGVYHGDINHNNVLFTPVERPVRAVVIDFGCAGVRADDEDEETWQFNLRFSADGTRIRRLLKDKGVANLDDPAVPQAA